MKLRTKLAVGLVVLTLVLSLATYGGLELYKDQQVKEVRDDVEETARLAATQVRSDMVSYRDDLAFVAGRVNGSDLEASGRERVGPFIAQNRFWAAYVANANGTIVAAIGPFNESERAAVEGTPLTVDCANRTLRTGDPCISGIRTPADRTPYVVMTAPVIHDGTVAGVVAAPINVDNEAFFSSLATLDTDEQSAWVSYRGTPLSPRGTDFRAAVTATASVPGTDLVVHVERDRSQLNDELRGLALAQSLGIFLVLAAVVALGYWEYSVNLRQAERLLDAFAAVEAGDYDHTLDLTVSEEWEEISHGFDELVAGLAARERALREREQRLGVLNRVMRHNVRNETNVIFSYADMVAEEVDDDYLAELVGKAGDAGRRLASLGEQARRVEKTLDGDEADPRPVDLAPLVRSAATDAATDFSDVDLRLDLPESRWARGAPAIAEAVDELVTNACKHTDAADPWVRVSLTTDTGFDGEAAVCLRVADNGPGIPEHERGAIEKGEETALEHSSGLGLWLVYWLVDRCDGALEFGESEAGGALVECRFHPAEPTEEQDGSDVDGPAGQN